MGVREMLSHPRFIPKLENKGLRYIASLKTDSSPEIFVKLLQIFPG